MRCSIMSPYACLAPNAAGSGTAPDASRSPVLWPPVMLPAAAQVGSGASAFCPSPAACSRSAGVRPGSPRGSNGICQCCLLGSCCCWEPQAKHGQLPQPAPADAQGATCSLRNEAAGWGMSAGACRHRPASPGSRRWPPPAACEHSAAACTAFPGSWAPDNWPWLGANT